MITAYDKVKAASALANGSPFIFCNKNYTLFDHSYFIIIDLILAITSDIHS